MKKLMLLIALLIAGVMTFAQEYATSGYEVGDTARDFLLKNVDGTMVAMADFPDARGFIVIFTCNHCPYSKAYEDRIIALDKKYKFKGYPVLAINPNDSVLVPEDSFSFMQVRAKEKGFTFPYLYDAGQKVYREYGAKRTPHVFLLEKKNVESPAANGRTNKEDVYIVRYIGAIDNNHTDAGKADEKYVEMAVDALISGNNPDPDFTKAIGCTIKDRAFINK
ncbi:MAG: thioredoxin family protein [Bacteroidales bacterium]|nr:thioredoxin family protein [Bacteroidales bacterium]